AAGPPGHGAKAGQASLSGSARGPAGAVAPVLLRLARRPGPAAALPAPSRQASRAVPAVGPRQPAAHRKPRSNARRRRASGVVDRQLGVCARRKTVHLSTGGRGGRPHPGPLPDGQGTRAGPERPIGDPKRTVLALDVPQPFGDAELLGDVLELVHHAGGHRDAALTPLGLVVVLDLTRKEDAGRPGRQPRILDLVDQLPHRLPELVE